MLQYFTFQQWEQSISSPLLRFSLEEGRQRVTSTTSTKGHKNCYSSVLMEDRTIYYWRVRLVRGNHFKIGVFMAEKQSLVPQGGAFSDGEWGWACYSTGEFRHQADSSSVQEPFETFGPGDEIGVRLDRVKGTLSFSKNRGPDKQMCTNTKFLNGSFVAAVSVLLQGESFQLGKVQCEQ